MKKEWNDVREFHEKFGHPVAAEPKMIDRKRALSRGKWMNEEVAEFLIADSIYEQADAMIDLMYFALGTLVEMGLDVQEPEGAFYMFINIKKYGMDSDTFCKKMLKEGLVGLIPGIHFGTEGYARLSYCYSDADLKEGLDRIEKFIRTL